RLLFAYGVLLDILDRTGLDYNDPDSRFAQQYARGFEAIDTLFPASLGYTLNTRDGTPPSVVPTGTLDMRGSTIQTQRGGDILVLGPGGDVGVGSTSAPPLVPASAFTAGIGPNNQGILVLEQGRIRMFTDQSVLLAQSRIFTEQGGDLLIWSSNGDINAGKGVKTSSEIPPPSFLCDVDHFCVPDAGSQVSGAGIAVLQTLAGQPSGVANLVAPGGTVDAGDAGIRVSGSLNVAALKVANADNIAVSGNASGVPTTVVDTGALGAASSVSASVSQSAVQSGGASRAREEPALMVNVEVLGFGGVPDEDED
ncbi:MAG: filamentous hemagglutinin family protein, partial [Gammaproteobacteria bacterium]